MSPSFSDFDKGPLRAVKPISRSQLKGGFGTDSGPSRGDPYRPAVRPTEASKAAVCYVRNTSRPDVAGRRGFDAVRHEENDPLVQNQMSTCQA